MSSAKETYRRLFEFVTRSYKVVFELVMVVTEGCVNW